VSAVSRKSLHSPRCGGVNDEVMTILLRSNAEARSID
jgi:hypothetical protein